MCVEILTRPSRVGTRRSILNPQTYVVETDMSSNKRSLLGVCESLQPRTIFGIMLGDERTFANKNTNHTTSGDGRAKLNERWSRKIMPHQQTNAQKTAKSRKR